MSAKEEPSCGEQASLEHIMASELYPKKSMKTEDPSLAVPYPVLPGESVEFLGKTADGVIALSNFRLLAKHGTVVMNIPLALVDTIECRDIFFLYVSCKDARSFRCAFSTNESCLEWYKHLSNSLNPPGKLQEVFAFSFHAWCVDECATSCSPELDPSYQLCQPAETTGYSFGREVDRLGFDLKKAWRICYVNEGFKTTATYPELHIVPASISDDDIKSAAAFRSSRRFPSVVWRDQRTGATICRSSQPEVGWLGWRSVHDENLLQAISKACSVNLPQKPATNGHIANGDVGDGLVETPEDEVKKMLIIDARSYAAALGNRAKGGGCECPEYYQNCEIQFMSLANIHTIRKSFQALRALCGAQPDQTTWLSGLENTKWLHHVAGLMRSAMVVVGAIAKEHRSVLVHCSDGWDRTPQIVALAELMLDPHYRTIEGFQVMVEREWLAFGHKFADRCALGKYAEDTNERCPIFLQFLDCVQQLIKQFPCAFQFNEAFLVKLVQHTYSCLFGNFLCNSESDRQKEKVVQQTSSVWSLLRPSSAKFRNYLYAPTVHQVLRPSCHLRHLNFWNAVYLSEDNYTGLSCNLEENYESASEGSQTPDQKVMTKTRSFDDIKAAVEAEDAPAMPRRLSDPNITGDTYLLGQEIAAEDKRLMLNQEVVTFKNLMSSEDVFGSEESETEAAAASCGVENDEAAAEMSEERLEESASHMLCNNITVIEGSTETLTGGELADTSAARPGGSRSNTPVVPMSCGTKDGSEPSEESDTLPVADLEGLSLCKSASISTSTTEISNSHISLKLPQHLSTVPRCNGTSLSLFIPDVAMAASGAVPNKQLSDPPAPSSRSSNDSGEAESPFTGNPRTPGSISPPTPGIERGTWQFGWRQTGGFIQQFDCDGLTTWVEAGQARLVQIESEYLTRIETLQRQLHLAKLALQHFTMYNGTSPHIIDGKDENGSQAESQESGEHLSLGAASDISWEHVEEKDAKMTLWVPDHAVTHCAGCNQEFWIVRRKHHCRNCGQVYCGDCTRFTSPVPQQQLNNPVRVCRQCYITIQGEDDLVPCNTNCRHCGEELQADEGLEILTSGRSTPDSDTDKTTTPTCS